MTSSLPASLSPKTRPAARAFPIARVAAPVAAAAAVKHAWRYATPAKTPIWGYAIALLASVALHAMIFVNSDSRPAPKPVAAVKPDVIEIQMPTLPPEEEPEQTVHELQEAAAPTVAVPQLAEVPSMVALNEFQQLVELRPAANVDLNGLKHLTVPVNFGRGGSGASLPSVFNLAELDRIPEAIAQTAPTYPHDARRLGIAEAKVDVQFIVDSEGRVLDARVVDSTNDLFDQSAVSAVQRWKFRPGMKGGRKVATRMQVPIKFAITNDE